jgi:hypothetical protein
MALALVALLCTSGGGAWASALQDRPRAGVVPKATAAMAREIRELAPLLESEDLAVRQATAERLMAMGEAALPIFEEEMRRQGLAPNGQVKLVLLRLRSLREDRVWDEAIAALARPARRSDYVIRKEGRTLANVKLKTGPPPPSAPQRSIQLEILIEPARQGGSSGVAGRVEGGGAGGGAGDGWGPDDAPGRDVPLKAQRLTALLALDRTLTPQRIELFEKGRERGALVLAEHRLRGQLDGKTIDAAAPPPLALDWALPLVVEVMPRVAETELALTVVEAATASTDGMLILRCLGAPRAAAGAKERSVIAYELQAAAVGGPVSFAPRRFEVDEKGRLLRAGLGNGSTLEAASER